jgi:DNA-binding SARP family transcriptional activator
MSRFTEVWDRPITFVNGPAGCGKTTLLAHYARAATSSGARVAWYQASRSEADSDALLRYLEHAVRGAVENRAPGSPWLTAEQAAGSLEQWIDRPLLLIVDDVHTLEASPAGSTLEQLASYLPSGVHVIASARGSCGWNVSRLKLSGRLVELGANDLRFRLWEIDQLFREHFDEPLSLAELFDLERETEGWAAGLTMFHLATGGCSVSERRRLLARRGAPWASLSDYFEQNVLGGVPASLRDFLVRTSVLGRLSSRLCDRLLERSGSAGILREIAARQIFLTTDDDGETWRYHSLFRAHLNSVLSDSIDAEEFRSRHRQAAGLLTASGDPGETIKALCQAEDWDGVRALLAELGSELAEDDPTRPGYTPPALLHGAASGLSPTQGTTAGSEQAPKSRSVGLDESVPTGVVGHIPPGTATPAPRGSRPAVQVHCFGRFAVLSHDGRPLDLRAVRPKSRSLIRWLAVESGHPLHRERIAAMLWPEDDILTAARKVQVAVSSLRQLLNTSGWGTLGLELRREGHSYLLEVGTGASIDVDMFSRQLAQAHTARQHGDLAEAASHIQASLAAYRGDLLPEEGPAEWVIEPRERLRVQAADAAEILVDLLTDLAEPVERLVGACELGLRIDRYRDGLWHRLIEFHQNRGSHANAARAQLQYDHILEELGLHPRRVLALTG